jgi:hypothetical protein
MLTSGFECLSYLWLKNVVSFVYSNKGLSLFLMEAKQQNPGEKHRESLFQIKDQMQILHIRDTSK